MFRDFATILKDMTASSVHTPTAIGNEKPKGKYRPFKAVIAETKAEKRGESPPTWSMPFTVAKADPDQRLIFGWASVVEKNGKMIFDHQDDGVPVDELEKAAYDFVLYSRENDDLHVGGPTGRCVESMVFTKEKQDALGIVLKDKDGDPFVGWWTGFKVDDDQLWAAHKRGERPEFSIGGQALRERIDQ